MTSPLLDIRAPITMDVLHANGRAYDVYCGWDREHSKFYHVWCYELKVVGTSKSPESARKACHNAMLREISWRGQLIKGGDMVGGQGRTSSDVANAALLAGACLFAGAVGFLWMVMR